MPKTKSWLYLLAGFYEENPVFRLILGLCPTLAVTTAAANGLAMGLAAIFVLIGSNLVISSLRNFIPSQIRIPSFIVIIATFVTMVDLTMTAYFPELHQKLGIFIPLIVVNCIVLGRAEAFASRNSPFPSLLDAVGMGTGFAFACVLIGTLREIFGAGKIFGHPLFGVHFRPVLVLLLPPGAFLVIGLLIGFFNHLEHLKSRGR